MSFQRVLIPSDIDNRLRYLAGRTGLTANLLCRCAFCLSLKEPGIPELSLYGGAGEGQGREINRYTLLGQYDLFFFSLLRERLQQDALPLDDETIEQQFKGHLFRGIGLLAVRVKSLEDLADFVVEVNKNIPPDYGEDNNHRPDSQPTFERTSSSVAAASPMTTTPTLLISKAPALVLWEQAMETIEIQKEQGRPRLSLALANDAQIKLVNETVTRYHYLHAPVDARCSLLAYLVLLGGHRIGCLVFGRPEATRVGDWYGDVKDKETGKCRLSRWEVLNLARIWLDPVAQENGAWYSPDLLPGFFDRQKRFHSRLATTVLAMALASVVVDYIVSYPPV